MSKIKIASPLYIVRQECEKDLFSVLDKIKGLGFDGVEFLGFFGKSPEEIHDKLEELGLAALGNHVDYYEFINDVHNTIEVHKKIGCNYITISGLPKDKLTDEVALSEYLYNIIDIGDLCSKEGITLLYHNHDHELTHLMKEDYLLEEILDGSPVDSLSFEPDLGWIMIGGADPGYFLNKYKDRCPVIHLKDFYAEDTTKVGNVHELNAQKGDKDHSYFEFRPVGYGIANTPALMKQIMACQPEWLVADHDLAYERDSYNDLKLSLDYIRNMLTVHQIHKDLYKN